MAKRIIRSDQKGLMLGKPDRKAERRERDKEAGKRKSRKAKTPEDIIQGQANSLYEQMQLPFLRLWEELFTAIETSRIPHGVKIDLYKKLRGWPDNMIFLPVGSKYNIAFFPELKSDVGKRRGSQKDKARELNIPIFKIFDKLFAETTEFVRFAEWLDGQLKRIEGE